VSVRVEAGVKPKRDADEDRDQHRPETEPDRPWREDADEVVDVARAKDHPRLTEVEGEEIPHIIYVLLPERFVEAELFADLWD
jgi:hypothetical protein